jgi:hypothetical protein
MMNCSSHSHSDPGYLSVVWRESQTIPSVRFAIKRVSLAGRIELTRRIRELTLRYEFLKAGDSADELEASLSEMLVQRLLLEWGLVEITGLTVDGEEGTTQILIEKGPETLAEEVLAAVRKEIGLSENERKNS